jgi:hypothetical protein
MSSIFFVLDRWIAAIAVGILWEEMLHAWNRSIAGRQFHRTVIGIESVSEGKHGDGCLGKLNICQPKTKESKF